MNFTLLGTTDITVILREDSTQNLTYLGENILVEFEVTGRGNIFNSNKIISVYFQCFCI